jgi:hypothetical protein
LGLQRYAFQNKIKIKFKKNYCKDFGAPATLYGMDIILVFGKQKSPPVLYNSNAVAVSL